VTTRAISITYVGPYPPIRGGISQHGYQLVRALHDRGATVNVISWRAQYPRPLYRGSQVPIPPRNDTHSLKWWSPVSWLKARLAVKDSDLLVVPYVSPVQVLPLRAILAGAQGCSIAIVHNAIPHERLPFSRTCLRLLLRHVDGVIVHSQVVADQIRSMSIDTPVSVIPHPPNLDLQQEPLPDGPPRALFFGYIRPYKGVDLLIEAIAELRESGTNLRVTIAGEPWTDPTELIRLAEQRGVDDLIDFQLGYLPDQQVGALLARHHLVIQPYRSATQSGVIPLAFAAGRGVVVTPVGGLGEAVEDGVNGFITSDVSSHALAEAITRAIDNLVKLTAGARGSAASWGDLADIILQILESGNGGTSRSRETPPTT